MRTPCFLEREDWSALLTDKYVRMMNERQQGGAWCRLARVSSILAGLLVSVAAAGAQSFTLDKFSIAGGGGTSAGGTFAVSGTVGQPEANAQPLTGGNFSLVGGFWSLFAVQTPGAPLLSITLNPQLSTVTVSWPSPSIGFILQQNADLNTTQWIAAPQAVSDTGSAKFIIVNPSAGKLFYRLYKP